MHAVKPILVFRNADLEKTRLFYEALGLTLVRELHEGCPPHYACDFGGALIEFYPASAKSPSVEPGQDLLMIFEVDRFDLVLDVCRQLRLKREPLTIYDPVRQLRVMTVRDPDGRRVHVREIGRQPPH